MSATDGDTATRRRGDAANKTPAPGPRPPAPAMANAIASPPAPKLAMTIASFAGCGYSPVAPGTAGSAAALAIAILLGWNPLWFAALAAARSRPCHLGRRPRRGIQRGGGPGAGGGG